MKQSNNNCNNKMSNRYRINLMSILIFTCYFLIPIVLMLLFLPLIKKYSTHIVNTALKFDYFVDLTNSISNNEIFNVILKKITFLLVNIFTVLSFLITLLLARKRNDSISNEKSNISISKKFILGFSFGFFMLISTYLISIIYTFMGFDVTSKNTQNIITCLKSEKFMLVLILLVAPIGEEIAFKYGLFTFFHELFIFKGKFLRVFLPALISAFVFGVIHDGFFLLPLYFIPSFIGCLIYEKTKSLIPCILGHFINNFFVAMLLMLT